MRVLTTCQDKGQIKVPEGHKCDLYALAPGDALLIDDDARTSEVVQIDKAQARRAEYAFRLRWIEGRTVALFTLDGRRYAQPVKPDPLPKRKRKDDQAYSEQTPVTTEEPAPSVQRVPRSRGKPLVLLDF